MQIVTSQCKKYIRVISDINELKSKKQKALIPLTDEEKNINKNIDIQTRILDAYKNIDHVQKENIKNMQTQKALAQLTLNNYKDDLKRTLEAERLQKEIEEAVETVGENFIRILNRTKDQITIFHKRTINF